MNIFTLTGTIMCDAADAQKSIKKTGEEADGLGDKLASGIKSAAKFGAGLAAGAGAAGAAMIALAKDTASTADTIDKASQRMGVSAEQYQEIAYQAGLSGVSMSALEKAAKNLDGISFEDAMEQIYGLNTAEERAAKAAELFGDSVAYQMTPMLNASGEEMAAMAEEAHSLGLVMSEDAVKGGAAMGDQFAKVEQSMQMLKTSLAVELMPYVEKILNWAIDNIPKALNTVHNVVDGIKTSIGSLTDWIQQKYEWAKNILGKIKGAISDARGSEDVGSHAAGLNYVPYDGYKAELHRGEMVLNANSTSNLASDIVEGIKSAIGSGAQNGPAEVVLELDGQILARTLFSSLKAESERRSPNLVVI